MQAIYSQRGLYLKAQPVVQFSRAMLTCTEASEMGCEPDKCAYTGETQPPPTPTDLGRYRAAGGHIHIEMEGFTETQWREVILLLEMLETLSLIETEGIIGSLAYMRRRWYGQSGRYRMTSYGVEWRTPSNYMWSEYKQAPEALFTSIDLAISLVKQGVTLQDLGTRTQIAKMRAIINAPLDLSAHRRKLHRTLWKSFLLPKHETIYNQVCGEDYGYRPNLFAA